MYIVLIEKGVYMNLSCIFRNARSTQSPVPAACVITLFQQGNGEELGILKIHRHTRKRT